jgi:hypothetical protein
VNSTSVSPLIEINLRRDGAAFQSSANADASHVLLGGIAPILTLTSLGKALRFYEVFIDSAELLRKDGGNK